LAEEADLRKYIILVITIVAFSGSGFATIINVPSDYPTIQQGINASFNGDTVLVRPGTYVENINFNGHNIVLGSLFLTTGDTTYIEETVIDGDSAGSVVTFEHGESQMANIAGFFLIDGNASGGGAINCSNNSNPRIISNLIISNYAYYGGGIYCEANSNPLILKNIIMENIGQYGGGIFCDGSLPEIAGNLIVNNIALFRGGGIYCSNQSNFSMINNTISRNTASNSGGGIYNNGGLPKAVNCIIWGNNSEHFDHEIHGLADITYSIIRGGWPGEGNLNIDPLFCDPEAINFHLKSINCGYNVNSPGIDAGSPNYSDEIISCIWGLGEEDSDMGAYGGLDSLIAPNRVINVPADYPTIQLAINASFRGDTVLVQPGTYAENINFNGHSIILGSLFLTTGDTAYISETIIDGNSAGSVVKFMAGEDSTAVLAGFTITNGSAANGGGIFCDSSEPSIFYNNIINNFADSSGAGIYLKQNANAHIRGNYIYQNSVSFENGGGIYCKLSNPEIMGNIISENFSGSDGTGGGICCVNRGNPWIQNNVVINNASGGIYCEFSNPEIVNNTISGNSLYGINCTMYSNPILANSIIWGNIANQLIVDSNSSPMVNYCDIQGGWPGPSNLDVDPRFVNPDMENYHLQSIECGYGQNSQCIDSGNPLYTDRILSCEWGLETPRSDQGAFGGGSDLISGNIIVVPRDYPNIQAAINSAINGDTILVIPGTYRENISILGPEIVLLSGFLLAGDSSLIYSTIIDGGSNGSVITINSRCQITGFTITNGMGGDRRGGGISLWGNSEDSEISFNRIVNNRCGYFNGSGGICISPGISPYIHDNLIDNNIAYDETRNYGYGGGIRVFYSSSPTICDNIISNNYAKTWGGAIYIYLARCVMQNNFIMSNEAGLKGGAVFDYSGDSLFLEGNTISGNIAGSEAGGIYITNGVMAHIDGNTISENMANEKAGGVYISSGAHARVDNNIIRENSSFMGGGVYFEGQGELAYNNFHRNYATFGAGIYCSTSDLIIIQNNMTYNSAIMRGAGIYCHDYSNPVISNNIISSNIGNGICLWLSAPMIINNVIVNNISSVSGGIYSIESEPLIINSIVRNNIDPVGSGIYAEGSMIPIVTFSNIESGWDGEGNIDVDPLFRDPQISDFHLMSIDCGDPYDSPCIDAGDPSLYDFSLECMWGLGESRSDMGAYGAGDSVMTPIDEFPMETPNEFALLQNYPNPFNPSTTISYSLPEQADVRIEIYNILGQKVATLFDGDQQAGQHEIVWRADEYPSGVYFARMSSAIGSKNIKMLLLK